MSKRLNANSKAATRLGAVFVGIGEPDYPPALRRIDGAPPLICGTR
jgi:DNA processing protein